MTKRFGFTLAEVLITLGIIGVVAAMTIPTLMNQTGQAEFKSGFKKVVSTLNQAITMNVALDSSDFSALTSGTTADTSLYGMFNSRMNVIKTGTASDVLGSASTGTNYALFFNDGMVISFPQACGQTSLNGSARNAMCAALVDVNGAKKPNKLSNCATAATATTESGGTCNTTNLVVGDQFSVIFYGQQILPNGVASKYIMYQ